MFGNQLINRQARVTDYQTYLNNNDLIAGACKTSQAISIHRQYI